MIPLYTISSKPDTVQEQCKLTEYFSFSAAYQARPGMKLPIIIQKDPKEKPELVMARWGAKKPLVTMDRILSTRPYNVLVRRQRCAIPANCFFALKKDQPHLVRLLQYRMFLMGGIFHYAEEEFYFALLQTDPADMLNSLEGQMPVVLAPEKLSSWLRGDEVGRIMHYADRSGSFWFDYFPVSKKILEPGQNSKELLGPQGVSQQQMKDHQKKLTAIAFEKERPNRSSMKY